MKPFQAVSLSNMIRSRLPALLLSAVLQLAPLLRVAVAESAAVVSPMVTILRWIAGVSAVTGAFHGVSAASGMTLQQGGAVVSTARGTNGVVLAGVRVTMFSNFGAPRSFSYHNLPPGLNGSAQGVITGIPTTPGLFEVTVSGWELANGSGNDFTTTFPFSIAAAATLDPPKITVPPASISVVVGAPLTLSATVVGSGLSYQWRKDGNPIPAPAGTAATFALSATQSGDSGTYTVVVTNASGSVESAGAVVTVVGVPVIQTGPASQTVPVGASVLLSPAVSGVGLSFQWFKGDAAIPGPAANTSSYLIPSAQPSDSGDYKVVVSNLAGSVTSEVATVVVVAAPFVAVPPLTQTVAEGAVVVLSATVDGIGVSYQWRKDGAIVPAPAGTSDSLVLNPVKTSDAGVYTLSASNLAGTTVSAGATLTVVSKPQLLLAPDGKTVGEGAVVTLTATVSGNGLTYQWSKDGAAIPAPAGTSATLDLGPVKPGDAGAYTLTVSNFAGSVTTPKAFVVVIATPTIVKSPSDLTVGVGAPVRLSATVTGEGLRYQWLKDGNPLPGPAGSAAVLEIPSAAVADAGVYALTVSNLGGSATSTGARLAVVPLPILEVPPQSQSVAVGATVTLSATVTGEGLSFQWLKDDVVIPAPIGTGPSLKLVAVQAGDAGVYRLRVTNLAGTVTSSPATLQVSAPSLDASLDVSPASGRVYEGEAVTLSVHVSTTAPLTFRWSREGAVLPSVTGATLSLSPVQASDAGSYRVEVSNGVTTATPAAVVTVVPLPLVSLASVVTDGSAVLTFPTQNGRKYSVEERPSVSSGDWLGVGAATGDGNAARVVLPAASAVNRFWRVRVLPLP